MKKLTIILTLLFITGLINCTFCQKLPVINLVPALERPSNINLSDFLESLSYVSLGTTPECLIDINPDILVTKDYILSTTGKRCLQFNRKNGAFIREIGKYGRGPGEFRSTYLGFLNEQSSTYYFQGWNGTFVKYTLDGVFRGNVKIPLYDESIHSSSFTDRYSFLDDTTLVCSFYFFEGIKNKSLLVFNEKGKIIKIFPNSNISIKKQDHTLSRSGEILFYRNDNKLFFYNMYNDTVFQLDRTRFIPSFIVNRGKYCPPFESRWWPSEKRNKANFISLLPVYFENKKFISFTVYQNKVSYFALYDKLSKSLKVIELTQELKNNLDGFRDLKFQSINDAGELICIIQPVDLLKWIKENPDKFRKLKPELQKLKEVKLEDNPIVVIAKLKRY